MRRSAATAPAAVRVLDNLGRVVRQAAFAAGQADLSLAISSLSTDVYTVETTSDAAPASRARLVVQ